MLNKQGPGKIDWTDYSFNPQSGCLHNCPYCYCQRLVERFDFDFKPKFHPKRLNDLNRLKGKPNQKIFVGSSGDTFGSWVPSENIQKILDTVKGYPEHTFQFLTKNPGRYMEFHLPDNGWYGTTVDGTARTVMNGQILPLIFGQQRIKNNHIKFISFEPLLHPTVEDLKDINWIIIGADSNRGARKPPDEWADRLIELARFHDCAVWVKDNYGYHTRIKEFPS